jgi:succinoglycan biosynthesis protein ExoM
MMSSTTVVICTFNRPGPLRRAVETARQQALAAGREAEVLVVDNSPDANAREAMRDLARVPGLPLRYLSVPMPNISHARNAGVAACASDFVVFLDDDEWCEPGWLDALIGTAEATGADLVFGAVLPEFPGGTPPWDPSGRSYERKMALPGGSRIGIDHDARISGRWIGTGNSLLRRATCLAGGTPFDPALGACGGEDYDLFVRLYEAGRSFHWCGDAVVHELVPADRTDTGYMRLRTYRTGQQWATITIRRSARPAWETARIGFRATVQLVLVTGLWSWSRLRGASDAPVRELKVAEVAGKLVWWTLERRTR